MASKVHTPAAARLQDTLVRPHITERATILAERGAYIFVVSPAATKRSIAQAVEAIYKVKPRKVTTATMPGKMRTGRKGIRGARAGYKKAVVYLKAGEKIDIV